MPTVTVTKENFNDLVEQSNILILDFWAEWCGPCKNFAPIFEAASEKHEDIVFGKSTQKKPNRARWRFQTAPFLH